MALTTVERVANELQLTEDSDRYQYIQAAINSATNYIETYCDRDFESVTATRDFAVDYNDNLLMVGDYSGLTQVQTRSSATADWVALATGTYNHYPIQHTIRDGIDLPSYAIYFVTPPPCIPGFASVRITATWGWVNIPPEIEQAAIYKAMEYLSRRGNPQGIVVPEVIPTDVKGLLAGYTRITM